MKDILQELSNHDLVLGSFYFKENENLSSFTDQYNVPETRIKRIALVLTQTMDALGGMVFDRFLLEGEDKRISLFSHDGGYCGIVFQSNVPYTSIENIYTELISKAPVIEEKPPEAKPEPAVAPKPKKEAPKVEVKPPPKEKEDKIIPATVFDEMGKILNEYLGDFSETIFENQMSDLKVKTEPTPFSKLQRLCFSLQKASAMLIGPSQAREMVDKLLSLIKS
jgi:hypothetical protein